jgi:adenosylcobinamide-phosphate synthase
MVRVSILLAAFLLDAVVGDPYWLPHPIRWIGNLIGFLDRRLRKCFPASPTGELLGGTVMALIVLLVSFGCAALLLTLCKQVNFALYWAVSVLLCCYMLAPRSLTVESGKVQHALENGTLEEARHAVSMIVGRDTACLDRAGVARAAVETVAENTSDGVIAPLLFMALFGPVGGVVYKAVNTMDSMVGYQNERYQYWGRFAAKLDDLLNFLPARISGVLMCAAAVLLRMDGKQAWKIFCRDRMNHKSPNSAQTEAACAGALQLQLGGSNYYFGTLVEKPTIGDPVREVTPQDIGRANRLMYGTALLALALCCAALAVIGLVF